jgi:hypothetical protein
MSSLLNQKMLDAVSVTLSSTSDAVTLDKFETCDVTAQITGANPSAKTFISGTYEVQTITFPTKAGATGGDYVVFYDQAGNAWAAALNKSGTDPVPTGALYTAIPAGRKTNVDISADTTAAQVAARVETAIDALTGLTAVITTDDSAANGTMTFTQLVPGPTTNAIPKNADDSGAGSITAAETTPGVASDVNLTSDSISEVGHGYGTGMKGALTTGGTLPVGLSATDYYAIRVDADNYKYATSQANALAGTAVDITGYGIGTHTFTPATALAGSVKLQKNNMPDGATAAWVDIASPASNTFSAAEDMDFGTFTASMRQIRAVATVTSGTVVASVQLNAKNISK